MTKALMVVGATSDAGKSLLCAALCRYFASKGYRTAPFKTLNISLNAYSTSEGGEIGMSQAFQAWAAGREPSVCMNPILIKPHGGGSCQYVVEGRPLEAAGAKATLREYLWQRAEACYRNLERDNDIIICEGSGSPAEINLRAYDIANMRTAHMASAPTLLVGDIDAGGVFAGIFGTYELLERHDKRLIAGYIINKFRGDESILQSGIDEISSRMGIPCLGVVPYVPLVFPAEDSLSLTRQECATTSADDIMKSWLGNLDTFVNVLEAHVSLKKIESIVQGGIDGL
jgi:adenosylcobyric acid synthase